MEHHFQVHLKGIIDLLSHHLYSGPHVFVRELLQNGVDAISARQKLDPKYQGKVEIELVQPEQGFPTIIFQDNGIGLTEEEVHRFLATIGQSSKRAELAEQRTDFIGQFGIGLLSCFMVADEIVVVTQSAKAGHPPIEWRGRQDGTYEIKKIDQVKIEPGTRVYLRARPDRLEYFTPEKIIELVRYFGELLPVPIYFHTDDRSIQVNDRRPPWERTYLTKEDEKSAYLAFGREMFNLEVRHYIPLYSEVGGVVGAAYVLPHSATLHTRSRHRVYLKGMLLSEKIEGLLPEWAVFLRCVVDAQSLRPVASREGFYEDENLEAVRHYFGETIRHHLLDLATTQPEMLNYIISLHHAAMRELAAEDDECLRVFGEWLPFQTTLGTMTLKQYRQKYDVIRYVSSVDAFRQIAQVAAAEDLCVINAGYYRDAEVIRKLKEMEPGLKIEHLDATTIAQHFEELALAERDQAFDLLRTAEIVLQPFRCGVDIKKFQPVSLPVLYINNDEEQFLRQAEQSKEVASSLWGDILDAVTAGKEEVSYASLCFNYNNPLVQRLMTIQDRQLIRRSVEMLYVQALLMGHHPLSNREMTLLNQGLLGLINIALEREKG
ncbi:HSP90 family protein [Thermoflavimicrobium dichotomicum]|uniref:Molecular chaperone HtpG n=1 Tax=Thermoflavimicrobium dichotomicum TaxID=46223 RepID=A0A1I3QT22_9BACL|nr:HSP90 family protein [Thermoflavimicrobium dichotomicum]SFJ36237.1 molecular chaperone HtpG [Thermoflavimicrobium dichotomicum]